MADQGKDETNVKEIKSKADFDEYIKGNVYVVVDFTAVWCPPCQFIGPIFSKMSVSADYDGVVFFKVDVDKQKDVAEKCGITCMPTFKFYENGELWHTMEGANEEELKGKTIALKNKKAPKELPQLQM